MDETEPLYSRTDRINAAFVIVFGLAAVALGADVLFDITGRIKGRRLAGEAAEHLAAR